MFFQLKKFLVIFLALLQLVAPLVHAHAGEITHTLANTGSAKLHIPGLESYATKYETKILATTGHLYNTEGVVIGVDAGIKQKQLKYSIDADNQYILPEQSVVIEYSLSPSDHNFSPHAPIHVCRHLIASHTPRAPPAQ